MSAADRTLTQAGAQPSAQQAVQVAALRAARTAALARRGAARVAGRANHPVLVCACGSERYALPLAAAARVLPMRACTPVPGAAPAVLGLAALSGRIVTVVGLARALGRPGAGRAEGGHLVVLRGATVPLALAVDRALGVAHLAEAPEAVGLGGDAVSRYAPAESGGAGLGDFVVIDLPRLLRRILP